MMENGLASIQGIAPIWEEICCIPSWDTISYGFYEKLDIKAKIVGHGKGGLVDKMKLDVDTTLTTFSDDAHFPEPIFWLGSGSGFYK